METKTTQSMNEEEKKDAPSGSEEAQEKAGESKINETRGLLKDESWRARKITEDEPPKAEILIQIGDAAILTRGNYTVIIGRKKSRKSLLGAYLIGLVKGKVIVFDTEQSPYHVWLLRQRIRHVKTDDGECIVVYLRGLSIDKKKQFIEEALEENPDTVAVLIDNVRDLLTNINDSEVAQKVSEFLEGLTWRHNVGLLCTIHTNKSDDKIRGHIGAELENKAFMVIKVRRCTGQSEVECESSRDGDFSPFILRHQEKTGMPEVFNLPVTESDEHAIFLEILTPGDLPFNELITCLRERCGSGGLMFPEQKARELLHKALDKGWVFKTGKDNSPATKYSLKKSGSATS